jgi:hypothetical protein
MADRFSMLFAARGAEVRELVARMQRLASQRDALRESLGRLTDEERRFLENHGESLREGQATLAGLISRQEKLQHDLDAARKELQSLRAKTKNFFAVLSTTLRYFAEAEGLSVSEIRERVAVLTRNEDAWDAALGEITIARAEQEQQLAGQNAPLESIRFAQEHLRTALKELKRRRQALARRLVRLLKEHVQFTPLSIWRHRCTGREDGEDLFARILSLRKKLRLAACLKTVRRKPAPEQVSLDVPHYVAALRHDLHLAKFPVQARIAMNGGGHYHKKESYRTANGQRRTRWRKREISFDDVIKFDFHVQSRGWRPKTIVKAMQDGATEAAVRGHRGADRRLVRRWRRCRKAIRKETRALLASLQLSA